MMVVKWFPSVAALLLLLLAIYGMIGAIFNYREFSSITHNNGKWPFNQKPIYKIFICAQCCYLIAGVLGIIAVVKDTLLYFLWSFFVLLGIFTVLLICGVVCLRVSFTDLQSDIYSAFRKNLTDEDDIDWLTDIQYRYNCCGIFTYMDWGVFHVNLPNGNTSVPDSCCRRELYYAAPNCGAGHLSANKTVAEAAQYININGCSQVISRMLWNNSKWIGGEMVIAAVCTFFVAAFIYGGVIKMYCITSETIRITNQNRTNRSNGPARSGYKRKNCSNTDGRNCPANSNRSDNIDNNNRGESSSRLPSGSKKLKRNNSRNSFTATESNIYSNKRGVGQTKRKSFLKSKLNRSNHNFTSQATNDSIYGSRRCKNNFPGGNLVDDKPTRHDTELLIRQNLEMLMNPIEGSFSTLSTTPNPSGSLNLFALQTSTSPTPGKSKNTEKVLKEPHLSHYASLPMVATYMSNFSDKGKGNILASDTHFYNESHFHRQRPQEFQDASPDVANPVNFVPGKFPSPSLTHSTTLATIQEETESLKSGAASTSPKAASPNTTPQSLSQKSSGNCSENNNPIPSLLYVCVEPQTVIIDIVDSEKIEQSEKDTEFTNILSETQLSKTDSTENTLQLKSTKEFSLSKSSSEGDQNEIKSQCEFPGILIENISIENSEPLRIPKSLLNTSVGISRKDSTYIDSNSEATSLNREIMAGQENPIAFES